MFFNISDSSWDNSLTWDKVLGNVYSWESSPTGPEWIAPPHCDSEYLNVTCRFWFARPMAYQYLADVEKNSIYGEKLLFLLDAFSKKKPGGFNRVLETGERLSNVTCVLNALIDTPVMTPDYLISILKMMYRDIRHLMENPDLGWSNWAVVRTSGLSKAIDFLPELKNSEKWKNSTRDLMSSLFDRMYSPDFSFKEAGLAYSFWCMELFSSSVKSASINNDPYSAFMRNRLEQAFDASLDLIYPNLYDTNIGDSNYQSKLTYLKKAGELFPTKKLAALLGDSSCKYPQSICYPYSGSVIMRSGTKKENAMYLAMHSIPFDGHAHDDIASLVFYAYGRPLLIDNGRYGYSKGNISAHLKTASAHNVLEIEGFNASSHSESGCRIRNFVSNSAFDFAVVELKPCKDFDSFHKRSVLFLKNEGFAIVSDYAKIDTTCAKFNQNWNFMPHSNQQADYNNHISTSFSHGGNISIVCPDFDSAEIKETIFSSGYGMAEKSFGSVFSKHGSSSSMTTLLLPFDKEKPRVSSYSTTPEDFSHSSAVFDIEEKRCVFYTKNTLAGSFLDCSFDGDMACILNGRVFIAGGSELNINSTQIISSPHIIKDLYLHISSGIVEIISSSLTKCTKRDEAIKIYAPKTTHVLLNGESIPFTLYSDYIYAVASV